MAAQPRQSWSSCDLSGPDTPGPIRPLTPLPRQSQDNFKLGYRSARFAFGYGACPDPEDSAKMMKLLEPMMKLLEPERIGVTLSEELQLHPEQSTDAFVLYHHEAKYFNV